eukprot:SAG22_NODE_310_length_12645_cov_20.450183_10_plen_422_part_00
MARRPKPSPGDWEDVLKEWSGSTSSGESDSESSRFDGDHLIGGTYNDRLGAYDMGWAGAGSAADSGGPSDPASSGEDDVSAAVAAADAWSLPPPAMNSYRTSTDSGYTSTSDHDDSADGEGWFSGVSSSDGTAGAAGIGADWELTWDSTSSDTGSSSSQGAPSPKPEAGGDDDDDDNDVFRNPAAVAVARPEQSSARRGARPPARQPADGSGGAGAGDDGAPGTPLAPVSIQKTKGTLRLFKLYSFEGCVPKDFLRFKFVSEAGRCYTLSAPTSRLASSACAFFGGKKSTMQYSLILGAIVGTAFRRKWPACSPAYALMRLTDTLNFALHVSCRRPLRLEDQRAGDGRVRPARGRLLWHQRQGERPGGQDAGAAAGAACLACMLSPPPCLCSCRLLSAQIACVPFVCCCRAMRLSWTTRRR